LDVDRPRRAVSDPIGVGLVGFGIAGRVFHSPLLTSLPEFDLRVVADRRDPGIRERLPHVRVAPDLTSLLRDDAVELVIIATPNATHARLATHALRSGRHVVVDKPFTPTVREADRLIALARSTGRVLSVFHSRRWDDDFQTVREVVSSGRLGRVRRYIARFEFLAHPVADDWRRTPGPGSGLLFDVGSHLIDQAVALFGLPRAVTARLTAADGRPDHAFVLLLDHGDVEVILLGSERTVLAGPTFEVHGEYGSLVVEGGRDGQERVLDAGLGPFAPIGPAAPARLVRQTGRATTVASVPRASTTYASYYRALARAIRDGIDPPVTAEAARDTIRVIEAAHRSARTGRTVQLD